MPGLDDQVKLTDCYVPIQVKQYLQPGLDRKQVYEIIELLRRDALSSKCVLYTHHSGGNKPSYHFTSATSLTESQVDSRFQCAMLCEESGILVDLRHQLAERKSILFTVFFKEAAKYLAEDVGVACQERRHGEQLYLAKAINIRDPHDRIKERVPPGMYRVVKFSPFLSANQMMHFPSRSVVFQSG